MVSRIYDDSLVDALRHFIRIVPKDSGDSGDSNAKYCSQKALTITTALWNVMTNVYSHTYLREVADTILEIGFFDRSGLRGKYNFGDRDVGEAYALLRGSLMAWCSADIAKTVLSEDSVEDAAVDTRARTWGACVEKVMSIRRKGREGAQLIRVLLEAPVK